MRVGSGMEVTMSSAEVGRPATPLARICDAAAEFGLPPNEIFEAIRYTLGRVPATASEARRGEELAGALATRLLARQRRA